MSAAAFVPVEAASPRPAAASVDAFQRAFAAALMQAPDADRGDDGDDARRAAPPGLPAFARQPGFAVYRNTVLAGCLDALRANYPTLRQLVGDDWFDAAAHIYVRAHWPDRGSLAAYGEALPGFLAGFAPAADLPYLAAVARLDRLWTEAHLAADAPVLDAGALAGLAPEQVAGSVLVPHPAARWAGFADVPAFTIWRRHRDGEDPGLDLAWHGEVALLTRPGASVEWLAIDAPCVAFLDACRQGAAFADAVAQAGDALLPMLPRLFAAGAFTRLDTGAPERLDTGAATRRPA